MRAQRRRSGVSFARPITASSVTQGLSPVLYGTGEPCRRRFVEKVVKSLKSGPRAKAFAPIVLIELRNIPMAQILLTLGVGCSVAQDAKSRVAQFGGW
ncbi:MAG: hypothetical protein ACXWVA_06625 [Rhodoplanes sp.]